MTSKQLSVSAVIVFGIFASFLSLYSEYSLSGFTCLSLSLSSYDILSCFHISLKKGKKIRGGEENERKVK
jgi:hypothetical protein